MTTETEKRVNASPEFYLPPYAWENGLIPWAPTPKQRYFLLLKQEEAFFGGAAGGAKTV